MKRWARRHIPERAWDNLATVSILGACAVLAFSFYLIHEGQVKAERNARQARILVVENKQRIADIQQSRIESCERTYAAIRQTLRQSFRPFIPKVDDPTTRRNEVRDAFLFFKTLDATINRFKGGCVNQTEPRRER